MIPDSTLYSMSPVTGRFAGWVTPESSATSLAISVNFSVFIPVSIPYMVSRASTVSSVGALPARSPMPLTVVWITEAPSAAARMLLATPIPKSMWKWVSSGAGVMLARTSTASSTLANCSVTATCVLPPSSTSAVCSTVRIPGSSNLSVY